MLSKRNFILKCVQQSKLNLRKSWLLDVKFESKHVCMASSCMDSHKKFKHHDLQRLGKNRVAKEVQHALLTPSYGSKHHYNYILNHFQFKTWT